MSNNTVSSGEDGGGIYAGNVSVPLGTTVIIDNNSTISGNTAGYGGGGLFLIETNLTVNDSTIGDNGAFEGAGVWAYNCVASVNDCTVRSNSATELGGGFSFINGLATINNSVMTGNSASGSVGGTGGALFFEGWSDNPHQVTNCLITDNIAYSDGGGLSNNIGAWVQITNCTFAGNEVTGSNGVGGGISCAEYWAWVEIFNSILWGNQASRRRFSNRGGQALSVHHLMEMVLTRMSMSVIVMFKAVKKVSGWKMKLKHILLCGGWMVILTKTRCSPQPRLPSRLTF